MKPQTELTHNKSPSMPIHPMLQGVMIRFLTLALALFAVNLCAKADDSATLPIKVMTRESLIARGTFVETFANQGDKGLMLHITITRADGSEKKSFTFIVAANSKREIGKLQGWTGKSGDKIQVTSDGYAEADTQIP
jgi:uncharacterized membrane protein YcgQ (UPF0703/DUF1980 family)